MQNLLAELIEEAGLTISKLQQTQLLGYVNLLNKWNKAYNLTSVRDPKEMLVKHLLDSLVVSEHLKGKRFIDVGTGPGLPGIPLAIVNPDAQFVLLDSLGKRITFIRQVIHELGITNVTAVKSRVEEYQAPAFDAVISRAFASLSDMVTWCHHLPAPNGVFFALKGQLDENEMADLPKNCSVIGIKPLIVPRLEGQRHLVILQREE